MADRKFRIALIVTTFNWPEALQCVLHSLLRQRMMPDEILIADDGSDGRTESVVESFRKKFPIPLKHVWQERNGFRKTTILNKAIASTNCHYIIQMDGDIIAHHSFVLDHAQNAERGHFVRGSRALLGKHLTMELLKNRGFMKIMPYAPDIRNRFNAIHHPVISRLLTSYRRSSGNVHGCNMSYWREDFILVNGYDNRFKGWGHEDIELAARFVNNGILQKKIKLKAVCFHLDHPLHARAEAERNFRWYTDTVRSGLKRCLDGYEEQQAKDYQDASHELPSVQPER